VGFEPTILVFERAKTSHALDRVARVYLMLLKQTDCFKFGKAADESLAQT
jgi:hypothetical protein